MPHLQQEEPGIFDFYGRAAPDRVTHSYIVVFSFLFNNLRKITRCFSPKVEEIAERGRPGCIQAAASMMLFF
jgi:hypothetical protein